MINQIPEPLLDAREVKRLLRCSLPLVYKMADQGRIPCIRWECPGEGKKKSRTMVRFKLQDILGFINANYRDVAAKS
ncbi:helix-turn-helix domain-containing protein [Thermodesulfobacteriota bacterium]